MKHAKEMLCFLLKFPKFEVVNWKALVWRTPVWASDLILVPLALATLVPYNFEGILDFCIIYSYSNSPKIWGQFDPRLSN